METDKNIPDLPPSYPRVKYFFTFSEVSFLVFQLKLKGKSEFICMYRVDFIFLDSNL